MVGEFLPLVLAGLLAGSIAANASSTVALFPGTLASSWAYRDDLRGVAGVGLAVLLPVSVAGGLVGAVLLLETPGGVFDAVIPWLLLLATLTFAGGRHLGDWLRRYVRIGRRAFLIMQFVLSIYGGYFGGAVGLMMMAVWTLIDAAELKAMAAPRALLVSAANGSAVLCFMFAGVVRWPQMLAMMVSAIAGGYYGARVARYLPGAVIRWFVVGLSGAVTVLFFLRKY
jgi:uncharacterized membrane protein YfcA